MIAVNTPNVMRLRGWAVAVIAFLVLVMCAQLLPINSIESAAASAPAKLSLAVDGTSTLNVTGIAATALAPVAAPTTLIGALTTKSVALGAPSTSAGTVLGCFELWCAVTAGLHLVLGAFQCVADVQNGNIIDLLSGACKQQFEDALKDTATLAAWKVSQTIAAALQDILKGAEITAMDWSGWILRDMLGGGNSIESPVLSCKLAVGNQALGCKDAWFLGQYNVMRQISLFMLLPLFMLVVIQSVLTGRMYLLARAAFIMLPASIIGAVVAVYFGQLMLNLSDDFVGMISNYTTSTTAYADNFQQSVQGMDATKMNYFAFVWFFILIFASIIIYIELLLRQVGVYMSAFFLPLGFAALIWPSSAGLFKKIVELLLGLIFSKVFIAAAVGLGITAFASVSAPGQQQAAGQAADATTSGLASLITGSLIFALAAFCGTKVIAMTPAAMTAAEGRVMPTQNWTSKLQMSNALMGRASGLKDWHNNSRRTPKNFNSGASNGRGTTPIPAAQRASKPSGPTGQGSTPPPPTPAQRRR